MIVENLTIVPGMFFHSTRRDGRHFNGVIESVRHLPKGTLVTLFHGWSNEGKDYISVYLENCIMWAASEYPFN